MMEFTALSANLWPISLVRLGSSFAINEIMSVTNSYLVSRAPLFYPSASHPHTQPEIIHGYYVEGFSKEIIHMQRNGKKEKMFMEWKRAKDGASLYVGWLI
jgi:hypothetical protein